MYDALKESFDKWDSGILIDGVECFGLFKNLDSYYLFDSHSCDEKGRLAPFGKACLLDCEDLETLYEKFQMRLPACCKQFNISPLKVFRFRYVFSFMKMKA